MGFLIVVKIVENFLPLFQNLTNNRSKFKALSTEDLKALFENL